MRARHQTRDVEEVDGDAADAGDAGSVVRAAAGLEGRGEGGAGAGAGEVEVADGAVGFDGCEGEVA